jgi:succinoglycan biosynthesis transport protein ExoP
MPATDTAFDLREYWAIARRRAPLWILPLVLVTLSAVGVSFLLEPRFRTSTTVMISDPQFLARSVETIVPSDMDTRVNPREQALLIESEIKSTATLSQLIDALDLDADPEVQKQVAKLMKVRAGADLKGVTYQYLIEKLREDVNVQVLSPSLVRINVTHRDPQLGVRMADKLGELFMDQRRRRELYAIRAALDFTDEQLEVYRNKQADSEERLRQFQKQSISTAYDDQLLNPSNVNAIVGEYDATQLELETLTEQQERALERINKFGADPTSWNPSRTLQRMEQDLLLRISGYVELLGRYTWRDATIVALNTSLNEDLDAIEETVQKEVDQTMSGESENFRRLWASYHFQTFRERFLRKKLDVLQQGTQQLKARSSRGPDYQITLANLQNEVEYNRGIVQRFVDQLTGTQIRQALQEAEAESHFKVIEPAVVPFEPVYPQKLKIALLGLVLGLLIGAALVIGFELADHSFRHPEQVEEYLGVTILGSVPRLSGGKVKA